MPNLNSKLSAYIGIAHIEFNEYLDHEAERAASIIDNYIEQMVDAARNTQHPYQLLHRLYILSNELPKAVGKACYEALHNCGRMSASRVVKALGRAIPKDGGFDVKVKEAVGGAILQAILKPFRKPVARIRNVISDMLIEPIKRSVLERIVLGGAVAISRLMQTVKHAFNPQRVADILVRDISDGKDRRAQIASLRNELAMPRAAAKRTVRTEGIRVATESNMAAYEELGDITIGYAIHAVLDEVTRPEHRARNGTIYYKYPVGGQKGINEMPRPPVEPDGSVAYNCILPGNIVEGTFTTAIRSHYSGQAIEIVSRQGRKLTVTPNHPICTDRGFVGAKHLKVGDNLVCHLVNDNGLAVPNDNKQHAPARIENVFGAAKELFPARVERSSSFNFHGDLPVNQSDVDVVDSMWILSRNANAGIFQTVCNLVLPSSNLEGGDVPGSGALFHDSDTILLSSSCLMGLQYLLGPLVSIHTAPLDLLRFGSGSQVCTSKFEVPAQAEPSISPGIIPAPSYPKFVTQLLERHASMVSLDDIVDIRYFDFDGHVYDLQSPYGFIIASGVYVSNCRCYLAPVFDKLENFETPTSSNVLPSILVYQDWWKNASDAKKRIAVGVRRFNYVAQRYGADASYSHFIDADGQLLSIKTLTAETAEQAAERIAANDALSNEARKRRASLLLTGGT